MSLYAIGDLHLHFQSELKHPAQLHDKVWKDHEVKFKRNCEKLITDEDTLVLVGDHSWGKKLAQCEEDLKYISDLPGRKILLRGNHDMFWDAKKTERLNDLYEGKLHFLRDHFTSTDTAMSSDGMRQMPPTPRRSSAGRQSASKFPLRRQEPTVSGNISCSCITRPQMFCRRTASSRK